MRRCAALVAVFLFALVFPVLAAGEPMPRYEDFPMPHGIYGRATCGDRAVVILVADDETTENAPYYRFYGWYWKDDSPKQDNAFIVVLVAGPGNDPDDRIYFDFQRDGFADEVLDWNQYDEKYPDDSMCGILTKVQ